MEVLQNHLAANLKCANKDYVSRPHFHNLVILISVCERHSFLKWMLPHSWLITVKTTCNRKQ